MRESYTLETCITKWGRRSGRYGAARLGADGANGCLLMVFVRKLAGAPCLTQADCSPACERSATQFNTQQDCRSAVFVIHSELPNGPHAVTAWNFRLACGEAVLMRIPNWHSISPHSRISARLRLRTLSLTPIEAWMSAPTEALGICQILGNAHLLSS
jgi:hypothetical protein